MVIKILIETKCGLVSEHFDFQSVPSTGDIIFVGTKSIPEIKLCVKLVEHYPVGEHTDHDLPGAVTLQCERLEH